MADERVRTPGAVHVIGLAWTCLLLLWAIVLPPLEGPDEVHSLDLVIDATDTSPLEWQVPFTDPVDRRLQVAWLSLGEDAGLSITREMGSWRDLLLAGPLVDVVTVANSRSADPPLGHRLLGYALAVTPQWFDVPLERLVFLLRLASLLALAPLPWLLARIAAVLNGRESVIASSAAGVFTFPRVAVQGTTVGPGALLVLASAIATLLLARIAVGQAQVRAQRWAGVVIAVAALLHPYGLALLLGVVGAVLVRRRSGDGARDLVEVAGNVLLPVLAVGWWYGVNSALLDAVQPGRAATALLPDVLRQVVVGVWGRTAAVPTASGEAAAVPLAVAGALSTLLVLAAAGAVRRRGIGAAVMLAGPAAVGLVTAIVMRPAADVVPLGGVDGGFSVSDQLAGLAGEALLVGLPGVLVLIAVGLQRGLPSRLRAWAWAPPLAAGLTLHGLLMGQLLVRRWAAGDASLTEGLLRIIGRSPRGVEAIAVVILGLLGGLCISVMVLVGRSRRLLIVDPDGG